MNALNLAENIIRLRHDKKITQEQLADFVGVTKASVSKWETKQSMPDILLLPQLAAFFDVTIDGLLGYEPQLSKEQMEKLYLELASDFAKNPFEEVIEKMKSYGNEPPADKSEKKAMRLTNWLNIWQTEYLTSVKPSTAYLYQRDIELYIIPALGRYKLNELFEIRIFLLILGNKFVIFELISI